MTLVDGMLKLGTAVRILPMTSSVAYGTVYVDVSYEARLLEIDFASGVWSLEFCDGSDEVMDDDEGFHNFLVGLRDQLSSQIKEKAPDLLTEG